MSKTSSEMVKQYGFTYDEHTHQLHTPNNYTFYHDSNYANEYHWGNPLEILTDFGAEVKSSGKDFVIIKLPPLWHLKPVSNNPHKMWLVDGISRHQAQLGLSDETGEFVGCVVTWLVLQLTAKAVNYNQSHDGKYLVQLLTHVRNPNLLPDSYRNKSFVTHEHYGSDVVDLSYARKEAFAEAEDYWNNLAQYED